VRLFNTSRFSALTHLRLTFFVPLVLLCLPAFAGSINISSPVAGSTSASAVRITASASESGSFHLELWDNGKKLGDIPASSVNAAYNLSAGSHTLTVEAVSNSGTFLNKSSVSYAVSDASPTGVSISSPTAGSTNSSAVRITASANESGSFHLELWDNGKKLGDVPASSVNAAYNLSAGSHTLTVEAVSNGGSLLNESRVSYTVSNASASGVNISNPVSGSTSISAVRITASAQESGAYHLEIWDNGYKLGQLSASSVNGVYVLPNGSHTLTVRAMGSGGTVLNQSSVSFKVANQCKTSSTVQCNLEQEAIDDTQADCDPPPVAKWVANPCGPGIQGSQGKDPESTRIAAATETGTIPDQGNMSLDGHSVHLSETRGSSWSNVLFRVQAPSSASTTSIDSHWILDEYVHLPDPSAHQAFEMDAQYIIDGIWTKFYTECSFNENNGTGYWAVFDTETGGWIFLNGQKQNGQTPPKVPCDRSQFTQPWSGSSNPSFTGWHHIVWSFVRNSGGTVTFKAVTVDATTTQVNFSPKSASGGLESDNGNVSALIQLDGVNNPDGLYNTVDAYIDEMSLTHTQ